MSVSLFINYSKTLREEFPVGTYETVTKTWYPLAVECELSLVPHFHSFLVIDEQNIQCVVKELEVLIQAMICKKFIPEANRAQGIHDVLEQLQNKTGWSASIG